jgi:hypothetical protein
MIWQKNGCLVHFEIVIILQCITYCLHFFCVIIALGHMEVCSMSFGQSRALSFTVQELPLLWNTYMHSKEYPEFWSFSLSCYTVCAAYSHCCWGWTYIPHTWGSAFCFLCFLFALVALFLLHAMHHVQTGIQCPVQLRNTLYISSLLFKPL